MVRALGIEPRTPAWKAGVLPLNYARITKVYICQETENGQGELSGEGRKIKCLADFLMKEPRPNPKRTCTHG